MIFLIFLIGLNILFLLILQLITKINIIISFYIVIHVINNKYKIFEK
jgi:hypothetical protein